jgi:DNA-directed RNA polymerase specialized sigma24 family protein
MTEKRYYVSNKKLYEQLVIHREKVLKAKENGEELPRANNYVGEAIFLICTRLAYKRNFLNYTYREDMVADGIENCVMAINTFDPTKTQNPFAYFTQIAFNAFIRRIAKEKKQTYLKYKNYQNLMIDSYLTDEDHMITSVPGNEIADQIIGTFEEKNLASKEKRNLKKGLEKFISEET